MSTSKVTLPKAILLIGLPATGKSTWVSAQDYDYDDPVVILSTDRYLETVAESAGQTYNEVFPDYIGIATSVMMDDFYFAKEHGFDIIWDQTNLSVKSRAKKIRLLHGYEIHAVVFGAELSIEEHHRRLASRIGKTIPAHILESMEDSYQKPNLDEGFTSIELL